MIMLMSMVFGSIGVVAGLLVSFHYGTGGGATIAGFCVLEFFVVLVGRAIYEAVRRNRAIALPA